MNVLLMDVETKLRKEACAEDMGQSSNDAAMKDAQVKPRMEEYVLDTEQRRNNMNALRMDAQTMLSKEECVLGMEQKSNDAAAKDVQSKLRKEECALGMVQRSNYVALKDVQTKPCVWECASSMEHVAMHPMNLLPLDQNLISLHQLKPEAIIELPELPSEDRKEGMFLKRSPSSVKKLLRSEYVFTFNWFNWCTVLIPKSLVGKLSQSELRGELFSKCCTMLCILL